MNYSNFTYERVLAELCAERGYKPILEQRSDNNPPVSSPAMAIISPSSIEELEGVNRCRLTSVVSFILVKNAAGATPAARSVIWNQIKCDAVNVVFDLKKIACILDVSDVEITPLTRTKGNYDEVSIKVEATLVSNLDGESDLAQII